MFLALGGDCVSAVWFRQLIVTDDAVAPRAGWAPAIR
jgi:hypothetical protein